MPYALIKDEMYDHPKFVGVQLDAIGLWTLGLSWCCRHLTDGFVPTAAVERLAAGSRRKAATMAAELTAHELWEPVEGGWQFHDFTDHNRSGAEVREKRDRVSQRRSEAGRKGAAARWGNGKADGKRDGKPIANGQANRVASEKQTDDPVPVPVPKHPPTPHGQPEGERPHEGAGGPAPEEEERQNHHRLVDAAMAAAAAHELAGLDQPPRHTDGWTAAKLKQYEPRRTRALDLLNAGIEPDQLGDFFITGQAPTIRTGPPPTEHWTPQMRAEALAESADTRAAIRATLAARHTTDPTQGDPPPMDPSIALDPVDPSGVAS